MVFGRVYKNFYLFAMAYKPISNFDFKNVEIRCMTLFQKYINNKYLLPAFHNSFPR